MKYGCSSAHVQASAGGSTRRRTRALGQVGRRCFGTLWRPHDHDRQRIPERERADGEALGCVQHRHSPLVGVSDPFQLSGTSSRDEHVLAQTLELKPAQLAQSIRALHAPNRATDAA
jgi:hypothetical protein